MVILRGIVKEIGIGSKEMAAALRRGKRIFKEVTDIYLCPPDNNRDCDNGSPKDCGHCQNGVCTRDYYI